MLLMLTANGALSVRGKKIFPVRGNALRVRKSFHCLKNPQRSFLHPFYGLRTLRLHHRSIQSVAEGTGPKMRPPTLALACKWEIQPLTGEIDCYSSLFSAGGKSSSFYHFPPQFHVVLLYFRIGDRRSSG